MEAAAIKIGPPGQSAQAKKLNRQKGRVPSHCLLSLATARVVGLFGATKADGGVADSRWDSRPETGRQMGAGGGNHGRVGRMCPGFWSSALWRDPCFAPLSALSSPHSLPNCRPAPSPACPSLPRRLSPMWAGKAPAVATGPQSPAFQVTEAQATCSTLDVAAIATIPGL